MYADRTILPVLVSVAICTVPHFLNVSLWVVIACLFLWAYTFTAVKNSWQLPGKLTLGILASCLFIAAMNTHEGYTLEAFVAVLALMVSLKLLEAKAGKDRVVTVTLCYFLIVSGLFFDDSILATSYMLFAIGTTTAVLIHINQTGQGILSPLKLSGILILQATPIMLVLFLLFPRIQSGLMGRAPVKAARTGFADFMSLENIAELAKNSSVAFRVDFKNGIPSRDQLYWRGAVLWSFDGKSWQRGVKRRNTTTRTWKPLNRVDYTITLEPHNEHWLLALDSPVRINARRAWLTADQTCYRWWPITQRIRYDGTSDISDQKPIVKEFLAEGLALPAKINPQSRALALAIWKASNSKAEYINKILQYFQSQGFTYTLRPPPLTAEKHIKNEDTSMGTNYIDRFLFESRKGFCEHFASSFAFLMRSVGIPARIVVGYQGGTLNQYGGYLVVRQTDAHAWCEVWEPQKGWVRIDPTAAVAPARLTGEVNDALPPEDTSVLLSFLHNGPFANWLGYTVNMWDYLNSQWNRVVMDYSPYDDLYFLNRLGINTESRKGWEKAALIALIAVTLITTVLFLTIYLKPQKNKTDEVARAWTVFCNKLARIGIPRRPEQGPLAYMNYVTQLHPAMKSQISEITTLYIDLRYRDKKGIKEINKLRLMVRRFSPPDLDQVS